jgi:hemerythrin
LLSPVKGKEYHNQGECLMAIEWNDSWTINVAEMDRQHKRLVGFINDLDKAMRDGRGKKVLGHILEELLDYTRTHFSEEEKLLAANDYPELEEHHKKHVSMTDKVQKMLDTYRSGNAALSIQVRSFLEQWLEKHIKGTDKKYAQFLNGKGIE